MKFVPSAQRRPGTRPRRHRTTGAFQGLTVTTLNEGRGLGPGDTRLRLFDDGPPRGRSTKAGDSAPATPAVSSLVPSASDVAQRRPGTRPRRHERDGRRPVLRLPRSTKAGDSAPATPASRSTSIPTTRRSRSTKAGDSAPATLTIQWQELALGSALNEGRGLGPGDTPRDRDPVDVAGLRSTKAGDSAPATRSPTDPGSARGGRSTKAGDSAPATPTDSTIVAVSYERSTKAGDSAPATPRIHWENRVACCGRSTNAGDSAPATQVVREDFGYRVYSAQRRPGTRPRRHPCGGRFVTGDTVIAQRRPGTRPRRHSV